MILPRVELSAEAPNPRASSEARAAARRGSSTRRAAQLSWIEADLSSTHQPWKIAVFHRSPYSSGTEHGSDLTVRAAFGPLFERYGVQLVLSGHEHDYQRSTPINGVTYIISGAGGRTRGTGEDTFTAVSWSVLHFTDVNVYRDHLLVRAIDQDARGFDEVVIPYTG